jgi:hypothetical protein
LEKVADQSSGERTLNEWATSVIVRNIEKFVLPDAGAKKWPVFRISVLRRWWQTADDADDFSSFIETKVFPFEKIGKMGVSCASVVTSSN